MLKAEVYNSLYLKVYFKKFILKSLYILKFINI